MLAYNIKNAYLTVDYRERLWVSVGLKRGSEARNNMLARKDLYRLKISDAAFRAFLVGNLDNMGYSPRYADPDLWLLPSVKLDSFKYYEYILCCVNYVL